MSRLPRPKSAFILATALVFFVFLLNIFLNSFFADYRIFLRDTASYHNTGSLMPLFHLAGELTGEVGVILRFAGACILLTFTSLIIFPVFSSLEVTNLESSLFEITSLIALVVWLKEHTVFSNLKLPHLNFRN